MNITKTNITEKTVGALNIAPTKISGQYKIFIDLNNKLWLDDYTGRRKAIDLSVSFLSQVANFLSVDSQIVSTDILRYGAFQKNNVKSYHIPFYFNSVENIPKYFVVSKVPNQEINKDFDLFNNSNIIRLVDFETLGFKNIFNEIEKENYFDYPVYFNWEDNNIKIFGYSINNSYPVAHTIDLSYLSSNQNYIDVVNNNILNNFADNKIIFPKFLNIEVEFSYTDNNNHFNNFSGFLATKENVLTTEDNKLYIKSKLTNEYSQVFNNKPFLLESYLYIDKDITIGELSTKSPQFTFSTNIFNVSDNIIIKNNDVEVFKYIITSNDLSTTLLETAYNICESATEQSNKDFVFSVINNNINSVTISIETSYDYDSCEVYLPILYVSVGNKFYSIKETDVVVFGNNSLLIDDITNLSIPTINNDNINSIENIYNIEDKFMYHNYLMFRLDRNPNLSGLNTKAFMFKTLIEELIELKPINLMSYYDEQESILSYDINKYKENLKQKFIDNEYFNKALLDFTETTDALYKYVETENNNLIDKPNLSINYNNEDFVKDMLFSSIGNCCYFLNNILNIDKQFWVNSGCVDINNTNDKLKYSWFLFKGEEPLYVLNTKNSLRYLDSNNRPKITSRVVKISESKCETIFLGVKYLLPIIYENYEFCVYLDFNNVDKLNIEYDVEIFDNEKLIMVRLNKYLDFQDLIRGGIKENQPLVDLSLFYNIKVSSNTSSDNIDIFTKNGFDISTFYNSESFTPLYKGVPQKNWITEDNKICIRKSIYSTNSLNEILPIIGDFSFDVYGEIIFKDKEYVYKFLTAKIKNISDLYDDYFWCDDLEINFYTDDEIYLYDSNDEIIKISKSEITNIVPKNISTLWGWYENISTINGLDYILLTNETISLKQTYFNIIQEITENVDGSKNYNKYVFKFPENNFNYNDNEFIDRFLPGKIENNIPDTYFDTSVYNANVDLYDVSQIWKLIKNVIYTEPRFKFLTKAQLNLFFNEFTTDYFFNYCNENSLEIINKTENNFIKLELVEIDKNLVIYNIEQEPKVYLINRQRTAYYPWFKDCDYFDFQLNTNKKYNTIFNLYDNNFGGIDISATGLWKEYTGNYISTLFCKENEILLSTNPQSIINYKTLLENTIVYDDCIITNKNSDYISKINKNEKQYIIGEYANMLLLQFYSLSEVVNSNNQRIPYNIDLKSDYSITLDNITNLDNVIIKLKRK